MNTQPVINSICLYEGSYQFKRIETEFNITADFALAQLAKQYEYRQTKETLWADIKVSGITNRYVLDYENKKVINTLNF